MAQPAKTGGDQGVEPAFREGHGSLGTECRCNTSPILVFPVGSLAQRIITFGGGEDPKHLQGIHILGLQVCPELIPCALGYVKIWELGSDVFDQTINT